MKTLRIGSGLGVGGGCIEDKLHQLDDFHHLTDIPTKFMSLYQHFGEIVLSLKHFIIKERENVYLYICNRGTVSKMCL